MSALDIKQAKDSLSWWLREWGVSDDPGRKARQFIDDLVDRGWIMSAQRETRPQPPTRADECPRHPGQWEMRCGACAIEPRVPVAEDRPTTRMSRTQALAAARAALVAAKHTEEDA